MPFAGAAESLDLGVPVVQKPFVGRDLLAALRSVNVPVRARVA